VIGAVRKIPGRLEPVHNSQGRLWVICVAAMSTACPLLLRSLPICCVRATDERGHKRHWPSIPFFEGDGAIIFKQACSLGCEGIVSKRLGSSYRSGRVN